MTDDIKQVIVIRKDLKMWRGKEIAQGAHSSHQFLIPIAQQGCGLTHIEKTWIDTGFKKVVVTVDSEQELMNLYIAAKKLGLRSHIILDEGRTEFNNVPTYTALAIGPDYSDRIDTLTRTLKLY